MVQKAFPARFWQQFVALLWKNVLVTRRNLRSTLLRLVAPCFFIVIVLLLDYAIRSDQANSEEFKEVSNPKSLAVDPIPHCDNDIYIKSPCYDFIYSPQGDPVIDDIMNNVRLNNVPEIPEERVLGFNDLDAANEWLLANTEKTPAGIHFVPGNSATMLDFSLQLNTTVKFFRGKSQDAITHVGMPLQVATQREIIRYHAETEGQGELESFNIGWKLFPHPVSKTDSIIGPTMGLFLFASSMFSFVMTMNGIISERETKITQSLTTMGMMRSAYWMSWMVWEVVIAFMVSIVAIAFGAAIQIDFFLNNSFGNTFFTLFLFQLAMVGFAFLLSSFIPKSSTATVVGFCIFLVGWVFQLVAIAGIPYSDDYFTKWGSILTIIFSAMPWVPFTKAIKDLGDATITSSAPGIAWSERVSHCTGDCHMNLATVFAVLIIEFFLYTTLAVYLSAVLPNDNGVRENPLFFLFPSFWWPHRSRTSSISTARSEPPPLARPDSDVVAEANTMREQLEANGATITRGSSATIEVYGLQRHFQQIVAGQKFWAVTDSWFSIPKNHLFCLLGPNGAGKSTTINILTGVLPPSGGDAVIGGESIRSVGGMDDIRATMGVCPQFDVLWSELTGEEHMLIYGNIKGLPDKHAVRSAATKLLSEVNLTYAELLRTGSYSGGMKRRLSVALALLGDPSVVFLDEPTTGMDPVSRRQVWDIIERAKRDRAVVLTTHSMEEADILGDRIAIMARGSLRCIGSSLHLKQKFGAGYQLAVSVMSAEEEASDAPRANRAAALKATVREKYGFEPVDESKAYTTFVINREHAGNLQTMLKDLEEQRESLGITDIQIALTTLEEVFLNIAKQAEIDNADAGIMIAVEIEPDTFVDAPVGADFVVDPKTGFQYKLRWGQDEHGTLLVDDVQRVVNVTSPRAAAAPPVATNHDSAVASVVL